MSDPVIVHGYHLSVYTHIVRMTLLQKEVAYISADINPFSDPISADYLKMNPFGRVPTLSHGEFQIYETAAIARYIDLSFDGPALIPADGKHAARMAQVISIIDNYGYWPMVRQVSSQRVFAPLFGETVDEAKVLEGLQASRVVLAALEKIAGEGLILDRQQITLADCHLAPMMGYFVQAIEGKQELKRHKALSRWWNWISDQQSFKDTEPLLPNTLSS